MRGDGVGEVVGWSLGSALAFEAVQHRLRLPQGRPQPVEAELALVARQQVEQHQAVAPVALEVELQFVARGGAAFQAAGPNAHADRIRHEGRGAIDSAKGDQDVEQGVQH